MLRRLKSNWSASSTSPGKPFLSFGTLPRSQTKDLVPLVDTALRYQAGLLEEKQIQVRKEMPDIAARFGLSW